MSAPWHEGPMCAFDLESDSTDVHTARIVQAATVDLRPADRGAADAPAFTVDRWNTLVDPGDDFTAMAPEAEAVHGITLDRVKTDGVPAPDALSHLTGALTDCWGRGGVVVGANIGGYDLSLLAAECRRHGLPPLVIAGPVIDVMTLDRCDLVHPRHRFRKRTDLAPDGQPVGSRKLVDAVRWWCVRMDPDLAHDASEDALAAVRVAWRIAREHPAIADMDRDQLNAYQAGQHAAWAQKLEQFKRAELEKAGATRDEIDAVRIDRDWPIRADLLTTPDTATTGAVA